LYYLFVIAAISFTSSVYAWDPFSWLVECIGDINAWHEVHPLPTYGAGAVSTLQKPMLRSTYTWRFCGKNNVTTEYVSPGDAKSISYGFTYVAPIVFHEDVCANKCVYGFREDQKEACKYNDNPSNFTQVLGMDMNGGDCYLSNAYKDSVQRCDTNLTAQYISLCKEFNGKMLGICGYRSEDTSIVAVTFGVSSAPTIGRNATAALKQAALSLKASSKQTELQVELRKKYDAAMRELGSGFRLIYPNELGKPKGRGCFPIRLAPLPPPFCDWKGIFDVREGVDYYVPPAAQTFEWPTISFCNGIENYVGKDGKLHICMMVDSPDVGKVLNPGSSSASTVKQCKLYQILDTKAANSTPNLTNSTCNTSSDPFKNKLNMGPFICNSNNQPPTELIPKTEYPNKACLIGFPPPADIRAAIPPEASRKNNPTQRYPDCGPPEKPTPATCVACDLRQCVDYYDFQFKCDVTFDTDGDKNAKLQQKCKTDIQDFCINKKGSSNNTYKNLSQCVCNRNSCKAGKSVPFSTDPCNSYDAAKASVTFGDPKNQWPCSLVKKVFGDS
jgi:hypothetical protein